MVKKGAVKIGFSEKSIVLTEGEGCFINHIVLHTGQVVADEACVLHSLLFLPSLISGSVESVFNQRYVKPLIEAHQLPFIVLEPCVSWQREALDLLEEAYFIYEANEFGFEWVVRDALSKIWHLIVKNKQELLELPSKPQDGSLNRVKTMLDFIHLNFQESLSLGEIARVASVSERECLRSFRKCVDVSPMQYLMVHRINVAARYLLETKMSVTEIGQMVGMDSPSYFSKKFREIKGLTPSAYRLRKV